uniref:Uncharacterized protein n=1 Tax=Leersia perrieri TaxID=77586 RepID=A0A0D9VMQ2_9ORYZ
MDSASKPPAELPTREGRQHGEKFSGHSPEMMASGFSSISSRRLPSMNVDAWHRKVAEVDRNAWEGMAYQ